MKPFRVVLLLGLVSAAACAPRREAPPPSPAPRPQPVPPPAQPVEPVPPPPVGDWRDIPLTPGGWIYRSEGGTSQALFGPATGAAAFILRCDRGSRQVSLWRQGVPTGNTMTIRTSSGARSLPLSVSTEPLPYAYGTVPAGDRFLDAIAFSRGRFTAEVPGIARIVIPAWPEPARVIEDCRS